MISSRTIAVYPLWLALFSDSAGMAVLKGFSRILETELRAQPKIKIRTNKKKVRVLVYVYIMQVNVTLKRGGGGGREERIFCICVFNRIFLLP